MAKFLIIFLLFTSFTFPFYYRLTWDGEGNLFRIYRSVEGGEFTQLADVTNILYLEDNIEEGVNYSYYVVAVNEWGVESDPSNILEVYSGYRGDANGDGEVNPADKLLIANYLAGNMEEKPGRLADVNDDFQIDLLDLVDWRFF